jgi:hypothetical protein
MKRGILLVQPFSPMRRHKISSVETAQARRSGVAAARGAPAASTDGAHMNWPEGFGSLTRDGPCLTLTASSASSANLVHVRDMSSRMVWTRGLGACAAIRWHSDARSRHSRGGIMTRTPKTKRGQRTPQAGHRSRRRQAGVNSTPLLHP